MGSLTTRQRSPRPPFRLTCPRDVDRNVWQAAHDSRDHVDRIKLEDLADDDSEVVTDPTPEEIVARAAAIRAKWGARETARRRVTVADPLMAMVITAADLFGALDDLTS